METNNEIFEGIFTYRQSEVAQILADDARLISEIDRDNLITYATRYMWAVKLAEQTRLQKEKMRADFGRELTDLEKYNAQLKALETVLENTIGKPIFKH